MLWLILALATIAFIALAVIYDKLILIDLRSKHIMATQVELAAQLTTSTATLSAAIDRIKGELGKADPALEAAVAANTAKIAEADAVVPVPPPTP